LFEVGVLLATPRRQWPNRKKGTINKKKKMNIKVKLELFEDRASQVAFFDSDWLPATLQHDSKTTLSVPIDDWQLAKRAKIHIKHPSTINSKSLVQNFGLHCIDNVCTTISSSNGRLRFFDWWTVPHSPSLDILLAARKAHNRTVYTEFCDEKQQIHATVEKVEERCLLSLCMDDDQLQRTKPMMQETENTFCVEITLQSLPCLVFDRADDAPKGNEQSGAPREGPVSDIE